MLALSNNKMKNYVSTLKHIVTFHNKKDWNRIKIDIHIYHAREKISININKYTPIFITIDELYENIRNGKEDLLKNIMYNNVIFKNKIIVLTIKKFEDIEILDAFSKHVIDNHMRFVSLKKQ